MVPSKILYEIVRHYPGRNVYELCAILQNFGYPPIHKSNLNSQLYHTDAPLEWRPGRGNERLWYIAEAGKGREVSYTERMELYPWQQEALIWWRDHGSNGVVEAVTGAGKTRLALAAAAEHLQEGNPVVIIVPTKELQSQWQREVNRWLRDGLGLEITIGLLGNGKNHVDRNPDVLIAIASSACRHYLLSARSRGLIIADEVHRYGAPSWSHALEPVFTKRLGLTGTYEREDNGLIEYLEPFFGEEVFEVNYERARADDVIAPFKIAYVGVCFTSDELEVYEEEEYRAYRNRRRLVDAFGLPDEPFGEFMQQANLLSRGGYGEATGIARSYLSAFSKKRQVLAGSSEKLRQAAALSPAVRAAERSILFAQTQAAAAAAIQSLNAKGISGAVLDSSMDMSERKEVFAGFETGEHELVAAPRLLDEGIDVPAADLAIVLASNRNRRQLVQRLGRVVRKKPDGRMARLAVLYVEGTTEDPEIGANEDFMYLVKDVAEDIQYFPAGTSASRICSYLNDWYQ
jgi:superfamily II DNA or RNA helicase